MQDLEKELAAAKAEIDKLRGKMARNRFLIKLEAVAWLILVVGFIQIILR